MKEKPYPAKMNITIPSYHMSSLSKSKTKIITIIETFVLIGALPKIIIPGKI